MSNYTQVNDYSAKGLLSTGDANKIIKGTDIDAEFSAISVAIATKANLAGPTFTGTTVFSGAVNHNGTVTAGAILYDLGNASDVKVPTAVDTDNDTSAASTAFVRNMMPAGLIMPYAGSASPDTTIWLLCSGQEVSASTYEDLFDVVIGDLDDFGRGTKVGDFTADESTEIFTLSSHGKSNGNVVHVDTDGGTLPAGLSTLTKYYIITSTTNTYQLSLTLGGSAVNITTNGSGTLRLFDNFAVPDLRGRLPLGKDNMGGTSADRVADTQADNLGQSSGVEEVTLTSAQSGQVAHGHTGVTRSAGGTDVFVGGGGGQIAFGSSDAIAAAAAASAHTNLQPYQTLNYLIKT